ncbi:hypothetical protein BD311DRAFT_804662 [Dichomitus squalens]|uniref:F-box domain-containing protein n=1 Tax=Dichomitus squalens TaxID=114155 RepID=A0A4Q9MXK8_9APHY|nr:hypothetical protein BD311DRAFT_804662 [Dichomitus squalens]
MRLQETAPLLTRFELKVDAEPYSPIIHSAMYSAIYSFKHLVSVRTGALPMDMPTIRYLAALPHLEIMEIRPADSISPRDLHWLAPDPLATILLHIHSARLETIHITAVTQDTPIPMGHALQLLSVVLSRNGSAIIKQLHLTIPVDRTSDVAMIDQHLEPLDRLGHLTHLRLQFHCPVIVTEAALARAAEAWPNIRELTIYPYFNQTESLVTHGCLIPFAQKCPHLKLPGLPVDARMSLLPADLRQSRAGLADMICPLERLEVGMSESLFSEPPMEVATFLLDIFPRLEGVASQHPYAFWLTVNMDCIPYLAQQRGREWRRSLDGPSSRW